ncbi:hypothetical protein Mgra_00008523 [Meloidogyne graminicola]|uniref:Uncharacterized protein n=1 Tax=Meloidogyne graminicola TaxID=189291 RepID=A0A8S9ZFK8_9BILA|nr:hypothetical protein Mgra_00008523 [Meloidogyne graminicola]
MQLLPNLTNFYNFSFLSLFVLIFLNSIVEGTLNKLISKFVNFSGASSSRRNHIHPYAEPEPPRRGFSSRDEAFNYRTMEDENFIELNFDNHLRNEHQQTNNAYTNRNDTDHIEQSHDVDVESDGFKKQEQLLFKMNNNVVKEEVEYDYYFTESDEEDSDVKSNSSTSFSNSHKSPLLAQTAQARLRNIDKNDLTSNKHKLMLNNGGIYKKEHGHLNYNSPRLQNHLRSGNENNTQKRSNIIVKKEKLNAKLKRYKSC